MNELERIEGAAMRDAVIAGGGRAEHVGGALCLAHPHVPIIEMNRALPLGASIDLDAVAEWYGSAAYVVQVTPERPELAVELERRGFTPGYAWMKFERGPEPAAAHETELTIAESDDQAAFGFVIAEGFGMPPAAAGVPAAVVGRPGWTCFVAWDADEPAGAAALFVDGGAAWIGIGATRPAFRGRGAQNALIAARIAAAHAQGATVVTTETGERAADRPSGSYRNILRGGFREAYLRANWRAPQA
jgi:GNAT superfamily N-acetyltransferase